MSKFWRIIKHFLWISMKVLKLQTKLDNNTLSKTLVRCNSNHLVSNKLQNLSVLSCSCQKLSNWWLQFGSNRKSSDMCVTNTWIGRAVSFVGFKYNFSCFETFDNIWWRKMSQQHPKSEFTYYEIFPCISPKPQPQPKQHEDPTVYSWPSINYVFQRKQKLKHSLDFLRSPLTKTPQRRDYN